ncbi:MAG: phage tail protein [Firmicutes bacterium]|nr:phage tail protein [Bacillota bacterium]
MADRNDPYRSFRFALEIDGIEAALFTEASGMNVSYDVIEFRAGDNKGRSVKLPGLTKIGNVTLKRGVSDAMDMWEWFKGDGEGIVGAIERKDVTIKALDEEGSETATWTLYEAWPCKYVVSNLNASESAVLIETLELAFEGFERTA